MSQFFTSSGPHIGVLASASILLINIQDWFPLAMRDKKVFLSKQYKELEENSRMGKTRDLFKKFGDTKGIFHAKIGAIKDGNNKDLTGAEEIKKRWGRYTQKNCTKKKRFGRPG